MGDSIPAVSLDQCQQYFSDPNVQHNILKRRYSQRLISMLGMLLIHAALDSSEALIPLFDKLPDGVETQLTALFDERYLHEIATFRSPAPLPAGLDQTWFQAEAFSAEDRIPTDFADLHSFPGVAEWSIDADLHRRKVEAYDRREMHLAWQQELTGRFNSLQWIHVARRTAANVQEIQELKTLLAPLRKEAKQDKPLLLVRSRKYRLFPDERQEAWMLQTMKACRRTWNCCVAHFNSTSTRQVQTTTMEEAKVAQNEGEDAPANTRTAGEFNAYHLQTLYVDKKSEGERTYPSGLGPPPAWVYNTPSSIRRAVTARFQTAVKAALTNLRRGNIKKFTMNFHSQQTHGKYTTFYDDAHYMSIHHDTQTSKTGRISISALKDIRASIPAGCRSMGPSPL